MRQSVNEIEWIFKNKIKLKFAVHILSQFCVSVYAFFSLVLLLLRLTTRDSLNCRNQKQLTSIALSVRIGIRLYALYLHSAICILQWMDFFSIPLRTCKKLLMRYTLLSVYLLNTLYLVQFSLVEKYFYKNSSNKRRERRNNFGKLFECSKCI